MEKHPTAKPFCNKGWRHLHVMSQIMPTAVTGAHVFSGHDGTVGIGQAAVPASQDVQEVQQHDDSPPWDESGFYGDSQVSSMTFCKVLDSNWTLQPESQAQDVEEPQLRPLTPTPTPSASHTPVPLRFSTPTPASQTQTPANHVSDPFFTLSLLMSSLAQIIPEASCFFSCSTCQASPCLRRCCCSSATSLISCKLW